MNLKQPTVEILLNSVGPEELGKYTDSVTGEEQLVFKTKGITIPYEDAEVSVSKTVDAIKGQAFVGVTGLLPCNECNYEYGITLVRRVKNPGINNSEYHPHQKFFGGVIPKLSEDTTNLGYMVSSQINSIVSTIVTQINEDTGYPGTPSYANPGAVADAYYGDLLTITDFTNYSINVNSLGAIANEARADLLVSLNALTGITAIAHPTDDTKLFIYSSSAITLALVDDITAQAGVYLIERFNDVSMAVQADAQYYEISKIVNGQFSRLTYNDVFAIFASQPKNDAHLSPLTWANQPLKEDYVKINIKYAHALPSLDGASHRSALIAQYNVYIPLSVIESTTDKWDSSDTMADTVDSADNNIDEFTTIGTQSGWTTLVNAL